MEISLSFLEESSNWTIFLILMAIFRIYLEIIDFDLNILPLTQKSKNAQRFHRFGLYMGIGYLITCLPQLGRIIFN